MFNVNLINILVNLTTYKIIQLKKKIMYIIILFDAPIFVFELGNINY